MDRMHRDIKPMFAFRFIKVNLRLRISLCFKNRNMFLQNDELKLGDFGISIKIYDTEKIYTSLFGSPLYNSPEVNQGINYSLKSDIW